MERELRVENCAQFIKDRAQWLCEKILEPLRLQMGELVITSGYRDLDRNKNAGGVETSFHLYSLDRCAADFYAPRAIIETVFDWMRLHSQLPFDKVILEVDKATGKPEVIHVQAMLTSTRPRTAWIGETHGTGSYRQVECSVLRGNQIQGAAQDETAKVAGGVEAKWPMNSSTPSC